MHVDLASATMQNNPYDAYAQMRQATEPVLVKDPMSKQDAFFLTRYEDVATVLKDGRFANDQRRLPNASDWTKKWYIPRAIKMFGDSMALADEPNHSRLRKLVHKAFTPQMVHSLEGQIAQMAHELLDTAVQKPHVDFMADFALPLPLNVICDMMGVHPQDRQNFHRWMGDSITDSSNANLFAMLPKVRNLFGLDRFLRRLIADRRRQPQADLTTALVQAEADGGQLSEDELAAMLLLILFAGHETTVNLLGSGLLALLDHPDQLALLKRQPALMDSAIEELLRYCNPVQHIAVRYAMEEVEIGGITIPAYSPVLLGIAAANRDETVFDHPDSLDITRQPNRHLGFGLGIHYCVGAPLARLEAKVGFEILFERFPTFQLAVPRDQLTWKGAPALRGLTHFPIHLQSQPIQAAVRG